MLNINRERTNVILGKKSRLIYGKDHITDTLCGVRFDISPRHSIRSTTTALSSSTALPGSLPS